MPRRCEGGQERHNAIKTWDVTYSWHLPIGPVWTDGNSRRNIGALITFDSCTEAWHTRLARYLYQLGKEATRGESWVWLEMKPTRNSRDLNLICLLFRGATMVVEKRRGENLVRHEEASNPEKGRRQGRCPLTPARRGWSDVESAGLWKRCTHYYVASGEIYGANNNGNMAFWLGGGDILGIRKQSGQMPKGYIPYFNRRKTLSQGSRMLQKGLWETQKNSGQEGGDSMRTLRPVSVKGPMARQLPNPNIKKIKVSIMVLRKAMSLVNQQFLVTFTKIWGNVT